MKKHYEIPEAQLVFLHPAEAVTVELGDISNPFELAVAEDEAAEEEAKTANS